MKVVVVFLVWVVLILGFVVFDQWWFTDSPTHVIPFHPPAPTASK